MASSRMATTVKLLRRAARSRLAETFRDSDPTLLGIEVDTLLAHSLGCESQSLIAQGEREVSEESQERFESALARRMKFEPVAYIVGSKEFYGREFLCTPATLIPRPDTETLIEAVLQGRSTLAVDATILDIGCGTACIGLTLALELGMHRSINRLILSDISQEALQVAKQNAARLAPASAIDFLCAHLGGALSSYPECTVSNLPYISEKEVLMPDVCQFEPKSALRAGSDGYELLFSLLSDWAARARSGAKLYLEIGASQHDALESFARGLGLSRIKFFQDLSGVYRVVEMKR